MAQSNKLSEFAQSVVERAQRNLGATRTVNGKKRRAVATGLLKDSLTFKVQQKSKNVTVIKFGAKGQAGQYADVVEDGRRPGKFPPISAIKKWMADKPIRLRDLKTNSFVKVTPARLDSTAFLIARHISKKGIKGLKYFEDALKAEVDERGDGFFAGMADEILAHITPNQRN